MMHYYEEQEVSGDLQPLRARLKELTALYEEAVEKVTATKDNDYIDFHARRMVEMAGHIIMAHLLILDTERNETFRTSTEVYTRYAEAEVRKNAAFIQSFDINDMTYYRRD